MSSIIIGYILSYNLCLSCDISLFRDYQQKNQSTKVHFNPWTQWEWKRHIIGKNHFLLLMPLFMDWMKKPRAFRFQSALCLPASPIPPAWLWWEVQNWKRERWKHSPQGELGLHLMFLRLISCAPVGWGSQCSNGCQGCEGHPVWHPEAVCCPRREAEWTVFHETLKLAMDIIKDRENVLGYPGEWLESRGKADCSAGLTAVAIQLRRKRRGGQLPLEKQIIQKRHKLCQGIQ